MTWLLRIFFSLCWLLPAAAGSVNGTIELIDSRDPEVRKHKNYSGVVVWLEAVGRPAAAGSADAVPQPSVMTQKMKTFTPHVLAIPAGTAVEFPNFDLVFHNAFSGYSGQVFDVGLYPPGRSRTVVFKREGVVRVFCNIHSTMSAVIVVLRTPYFAVSDSIGNYAIPDVPPGEYRLHVYHERALQQNLAAMEQTVKVPAGDLCVRRFVISETGYVQLPHNNKYGLDYPSAGDDLLYSREAK
jgi:plastocyanin